MFGNLHQSILANKSYQLVFIGTYEHLSTVVATLLNGSETLAVKGFLWRECISSIVCCRIWNN